MPWRSVHAARTLTPRYKHKQTGEPLSAYALDLTLRFNKTGAGFLQDHNFVGDPADGTFPHNNLAELQETSTTPTLRSTSRRAWDAGGRPSAGASSCSLAARRNRNREPGSVQSADPQVRISAGRRAIASALPS